MEEYKMSEDIINNTVFDETVLALPEQLQILPENILSLFRDYEQGNLEPVSSQELREILDNWFGNKHVPESEHECTPNDLDDRFPSWTGKRQRVERDV